MVCGRLGGLTLCLFCCNQCRVHNEYTAAVNMHVVIIVPVMCEILDT